MPPVQADRHGPHGPRRLPRVTEGGSPSAPRPARGGRGPPERPGLGEASAVWGARGRVRAGSGTEPGAEGPEEGHSGARGSHAARPMFGPHLGPVRPRRAPPWPAALPWGRAGVTGTAGAAAAPAGIPHGNGRGATFELVKQAVCFRCRAK